MFNEGDMIGSYRLVSMLGAGGMATVYKAHHPKLDRYVALKMMHNSFLSDPQFVARFEREAQIVARLEHPNIVPVHDFAEYEGQPYLVMRLISGISLRDALNDGALELKDIMAIMPRIADALDYAHRQGVLHRDIKPSNIMLELDSTPYLTDFGLARTVQAGESSLSQGVLIGTPAYMSPEQGAGERDLDSRSDLYSLGIVLYELVVGKVPFSGTTTYKILHGHQTEPPPPPSSINPDIPPAVEMVLLKALSKEPEDRYESATVMLAELREAFITSNVRRLNTGVRHSIIISLEKSNVDSKSKPLPRGNSISTPRTALAAPNERALSKGSAPSAKTGIPIPGQLVVEGNAVRASSVARSSGDKLVYVLVGMLLVLVVVLVGVLALNARNNAIRITPTAVAAATRATIAPTATPIPARGAIPPWINSTEEVGAINQPPDSGSQAQGGNQGQGNQPQGGNQGQGGNQPQGGRERRMIPLPSNVELYEVPLDVSNSEAQAMIDTQPNNPVGYLIQLRNAVTVQPPQRPNGVLITRSITDGARVADDMDRYRATVVSILSTSGTPPEIVFDFYNATLREIANPVIHEAIRQRIGQDLYIVMSNGGNHPDFMVDTISEMLQNDPDAAPDPLIWVMLARLAISHNRIEEAQTFLDRAGVDFSEAYLVQGDLYAVDGDFEQASAAWEQARAFPDAPEWVQQVATEYLGISP